MNVRAGSLFYQVADVASLSSCMKLVFTEIGFDISALSQPGRVKPAGQQTFVLLRFYWCASMRSNLCS